MIDYLNTLDLLPFVKKDIIIYYILIITSLRLGGLVIAAKILALVGWDLRGTLNNNY